MKIYNYNPNDNTYLGISVADPDPLEEGVWLIPAYATAIAPPKFDPTVKVCTFSVQDNKWILSNIPTPTIVEPSPEEVLAIKVARARSDRDIMLREADHKINELEDAGKDSKEWRSYRQALRDVPSQKDFPNTINWPVSPDRRK